SRISKADIDGIGKTVVCWAVYVGARNTRQHCIPQFAFPEQTMLRVRFKFLSGKCRGDTKANGSSNILCAGTLFPFLRTTMEERGDRRTFTDIEGSDAF